MSHMRHGIGTWGGVRSGGADARSTIHATIVWTYRDAPKRNWHSGIQRCVVLTQIERKSRAWAAVDIHKALCRRADTRRHANTDLISITIAPDVTEIGPDTFFGCRRVTRVTTFEGILHIGDRAFADCTSRKDITIPDGVTSIGSAAFSNCSQLTEVLVPGSVNSIGTWAGCSGLTSITVPRPAMDSSGFDRIGSDSTSPPEAI